MFNGMYSSIVLSWSLIAINIIDVQGSFPAKYYVQNTSRDSCCLDNNYQAFLLVDDGSVGRRGGETGFRAKLEDYISHQRTGIWGETWDNEGKRLFFLWSDSGAELEEVCLLLDKCVFAAFEENSQPLTCSRTIRTHCKLFSPLVVSF